MNRTAIAISLVACGALHQGCDPPCSAPAHAALLFEASVDVAMCGQHRFLDDEATTQRFIACVESASRDGRPFVVSFNIGAFSHVPVDNMLVGRSHLGQFQVFALVGVQPHTSVAKVFVSRCTESLRLVARRNFTTGLNIEYECGAVADTPNPPYAPGTGQTTGLVCGVDDSLTPYAPRPTGDAGAFADSSL